MDILGIIKEKALLKKRKILLIEGDDERVIEAAKMASFCEPVLLTDKTISGLKTRKLGITPEHISKLCKLREHKGLKEKEAQELLKDPNYFGALLLALGEYDGAVGGCKYSTAEWMRPVFQIVGPKKGVNTISAVCFIIIGEKAYFFSDTDFNIEPNSSELAEITINANDFVKAMGIKPKVSMLSYSTKGSGEHPVLEHIRDALAIVKKKRKDIIIDGEMQLDASINPDAAMRKAPNSVLKGDANVLIFPNITVGNVLIHGLVQWTNYRFFGSFPVGLAKPVINGGRSMNAAQIHDLILACAMEANL